MKSTLPTGCSTRSGSPSRRPQGLPQTTPVPRRESPHPSLCAKKYDEAREIWQARVNDDRRFYFKIVDDTYRLENLKKHPK